jgi:hypothetical protein
MDVCWLFHLPCLRLTSIILRYEPMTRVEFETTIVNPIYGVEEDQSLENIHPHRLSVFFIILAIGASSDENGDFVAAKFHALAAAALSLGSILKTVTLCSLQALFLMVYYGYFSKPATDETRYLLFGACTRAAQHVRHMLYYPRNANMVRLQINLRKCGALGYSFKMTSNTFNRERSRDEA